MPERSGLPSAVRGTAPLAAGAACPLTTPEPISMAAADATTIQIDARSRISECSDEEQGAFHAKPCHAFDEFRRVRWRKGAESRAARVRAREH
jgi:hypothetical protein